MPATAPNVLLLVTDQHRGDCLGYAGHPVLQTPYLDELAARGFYFPHAYSAHPQCIPARRTLLTGTCANTHGVYCNYAGPPLPSPTLPEVFAENGYHTHLCGKIHTFPERALYGFMSADWADNVVRTGTSDYDAFLEEQGLTGSRRQLSYSASANTWVARPWPHAEHLHPTHWTTDCALRFLTRRDPTKPFFLKVSYYFPHQPCIPPQAFWDRYIHADLPPPIEAEWSHKQDEYVPGLPVDAWQTLLRPAEMQQFRAGYYGLINHIDEQIGRLLRSLPKDTVILFCSDHGELLGDHQWVRKTRGLEGSARIPFILNLPESLELSGGETREEPVELMDVMPTLLDAAGIEIPDTVEGSSLIRRLRGESSWRDWVHGENAVIGGEPGSMQYLTDGNRKYIWEPGLGRELFFNLEQDPGETLNLAEAPAAAEEVARWRDRLIAILADRPEGFVREGRLATLEGPTRTIHERYRRPSDSS
ncbi:MAG: sulfatase-like hydrolase/transferase [Opitutales bacterium]